MIGDNENNFPHKLLLTNRQVFKPLAKSVLIPLGLTTAASAADAGIHKKILGSGNNSHSSSALHITLIISNDENDDIIKIVQSLEDSSLLLKGVTEIVQNEVKEQKGGFLSMNTRYIRCNFIRKSFNWKGNI